MIEEEGLNMNASAVSGGGDVTHLLSPKSPVRNFTEDTFETPRSPREGGQMISMRKAR
jgi:hypothetical protein